MNVGVGRLRLRIAGDSWNSDEKSIWHSSLGLSCRFDHLRGDTLSGMGVLGGYLQRCGRSPKFIDIGFLFAGMFAQAPFAFAKACNASVS
jgi:hypothetical protein